VVRYEPVEGCLFARYLRYAKKIILGISIICLLLFFSYALISNKNPSKLTDSGVGTDCLRKLYLILYRSEGGSDWICF